MTFFSTKNPNLIFFPFFFRGGVGAGGEGGASVSELFFTKNPNLKYFFFFWGGGWGGGLELVKLSNKPKLGA